MAIRCINPADIPLTFDTAQIHVDVDQIPQFRKVELAKAALNLVDLVFSQPGAEERFQEWRAKRHAAQEAEKENKKGPAGC